MSRFLLSILVMLSVLSLSNAQDAELMDMTPAQRAAFQKATVPEAQEINVERVLNESDYDSPSNSAKGAPEAPLLATYDVETITGSNLCLGVEYAFGYLWVTHAGASSTGPPNYLAQIDISGPTPVLVANHDQGATGAWGWRDLCSDGSFLYASPDNGLVYQIDPATGSHTGVTIPGPQSPNRALAYDPATDHFWTVNFSSNLYEFDRNGTIITQFPNPVSSYGAAWDPYSQGGPWLWLNAGTSTGDIYHMDQVDPSTGLLTGVSEPGIQGIAGGLDIDIDIFPGKIAAVALGQGTPDVVDVWDFGDYGDPDDPLPPDNFAAYSDLNMPTSMLLTWDDPTQYINGDPLTNFQIIIAREGTVIDSVAMGAETYTDAGPLTTGQEYTYEIWAKDFNDSVSSPVSASWHAGGHPVPSPPTAFSLVSAGGGDLKARWTNPSTNVDGTPMGDFDAINIYENGVLLTTFSRSPADTGRADSAVFTPGSPNQPYYVTALDDDSPPNESGPSNTAFPPFSAPYLEDFEGATPGTPGVLPPQWTNETDDDFDWYVDEGGTPSSGTGPLVDHTTGTASGNYMFTESSSPNYPNMVAHLTTPFVDLSNVSQPGIAFWYHMHGAAMGELHVDVFANGVWNQDVMPPLVGQQQPNQSDPWLQAVIDLSAYAANPVQVRFRGITGTSFTSDMAIDDVFFGSLDANPQMVVSPLSISDTLLVGGASDHTVTVSNIAALPTSLNYTVTQNPPVSWLTVTPTSGTVTSGQSEDLNVTLDASSLSAGTYNTELIVAGNDSTNLEDTVSVLLEVNEAPAMSVFPDTFDVTVASGDTATDTLTIYNTGTGPLDYEVLIGGAAPELMYYKFNEVGSNQTQNFAAPGTPVPQFASVLGLTMGGTGFEGAALIGNGGSSGSNYVDTGWITNLGSGSWTISMWLNNVDNSTTLYYHFGDNTANSFRCFSGGVAGAGNLMVRGGGLTDINITGVAPGPSLVEVVYDAAASEARAYVNGVLNVTVPQSGVNIVGTANFKVGGYSTSTGLANGELMDEWKLYDHAIDVTAAADQEFWLRANPSAGIIPANDSAKVVFTFDPSGLLGGDYDTEVIIAGNDPVNPEDTVGVHMFVQAEPDIDFSPRPVSFDTTFVGGASTMSAHVLNNGAGVLDVTSITLTNSVFSVDTSSFMVPPLDSFEVIVSYNPTTAGVDNGWILIQSNDPDTPVDSVAISGIAADAPVADITPNFTNPVDVQENDSTDVSISILNAAGPSGARLIWSAAVSDDPATPAAYRPTPTGKPTVSEALEVSPNQTPLPAAWIEAPFDLQFSYNLEVITGALGNAGTEFDGTSFYTTRWASNLLHEITTAGTLVREFSVTGVTGLRDLAYDGAFFYGGAAATTIYQMDFSTTPGTLIGTITSPVPVRYIAYDEGADAFWVGNWDTPPTLVSRSGTNLGSITSGVTSQYGAAYDSYTDGGPYLWIYDQGLGAGNPQFIHQIDIAAGVPTGFVFDVKSVVGGGDPNAIAGGLWISEGIEPGLATLGGLQQGTPDMLFGLELAQTAPAWIQLIPPTSGALDPGDQYDLMVRLYGVGESPDTAWVNITTNDPGVPVANVMVIREIITGIGDLEEMPKTFAISQNYPNPFNPTTTFKYQLPRQSDVKLVIYNVLGQKVRTLINGQVEAGYHNAVWDGRNDKGVQAASGIYIYRFEAGDYVKTMKMMLLK